MQVYSLICDTLLYFTVAVRFHVDTTYDRCLSSCSCPEALPTRVASTNYDVWTLQWMDSGKSAVSIYSFVSQLFDFVFWYCFDFRHINPYQSSNLINQTLQSIKQLIHQWMNQLTN